MESGNEATVWGMESGNEARKMESGNEATTLRGMESGNEATTLRGMESGNEATTLRGMESGNEHRRRKQSVSRGAPLVEAAKRRGKSVFPTVQSARAPTTYKA